MKTKSTSRQFKTFSFTELKTLISNLLSLDKRYIKIRNSDTTKSYYNISICGETFETFYIKDLSHEVFKEVLNNKISNATRTKILKLKIDYILKEDV